MDVFQQVFFLSLSSSSISDDKDTQTELQNSLEKNLSLSLSPLKLLGWKIVWGPVVWKNKPDDATTGPDNSWYVAYNPALRFEDGKTHPAYVIAIAGTPRYSDYAWINEDFAVDSVVDFNTWVESGIEKQPVVVPAVNVVPGTPYIAKGTVKVVHLLLNTPAPQSVKGAGKTLLDFITHVGSEGTNRVISTGHNLGGALSPSLALTLVSSGVIRADRTLTYPTAGPSPGNRAFTELFTATLPARKKDGARSYQGWNLNLVNTLDIVPQAWCVQKSVSPKQNLGNIPTIYGKPALWKVKGITIALVGQALRSGVLYLPLPSQYFTSTPPSSAPKSLEEFIKLACSSHIEAYIKEVGVDITQRKPEMLSLGLSMKKEEEIRLNYPVIAGYDWALDHPEEAQGGIEKVEGTVEGEALVVELE